MAETAIEFPRYMMIVNERKLFVTMPVAGEMYNGNWVKVEIGGLVLEREGDSITARDITAEERRKISQIADSISNSK